MTAYLSEVFSCIQGEGLFVGQRHLFVRFAGCNLACAYCDTQAARGRTEAFRLETTPGRRDFVSRPNPVGEEPFVDLVTGLAGAEPAHEAISLTGGEPLLQADFIAAVGTRLRGTGLVLYLETNGVLPQAMERVVDCIDVVAMDVKLASVTGEPSRLDAHRAFLRVAARKQAFVKVVVGQATTDREFEQACALVAEVDPDIPVVLQPVTGSARLDEGRLLAMQAVGSRHVRAVRVIPQVHKLMGCR